MLAHPVAGTFDLDDDGVVQKPIEQRGSHYRIAKDLAPLCKAAVGGQDRGAFLVAGIDELEEQIGSPRRDRQISDLINDQESGSGEEANLLPERAFALSLGELGDQVGQWNKVDAPSRPDGLNGQGRRDVAFAGAGWTEQMDDLGPIDEVEASKRQDAVAVERRLEGEVVAGQRLDHRQPRHAQGGFDPPVLTQGEFLDQQLLKRRDAVNLPLLDPAQGGVQHLQGAGHPEADEAPADAVDPSRLRCDRHGRRSLAS